jgi:hypothetical protein
MESPKAALRFTVQLVRQLKNLNLLLLPCLLKSLIPISKKSPNPKRCRKLIWGRKMSLLDVSPNF